MKKKIFDDIVLTEDEQVTSDTAEELTNGKGEDEDE